MEFSKLPPRDTDKILILYAHYFLAAELMLNNSKKLRAKWEKRGQLSQSDRVQYSIYFSTWLGFLGVTAEGFGKLDIRKLLQEARPLDFDELIHLADGLGKLLKEHKDALRKYRNNVFHLRDSNEEMLSFLRDRPSRVAWAEELQAAFHHFFSNYRILCQVQYLLENRSDGLIKSRRPG